MPDSHPFGVRRGGGGPSASAILTSFEVYWQSLDVAGEMGPDQMVLIRFVSGTNGLKPLLRKH